MLSDERFGFTNRLALPTFEVDGMRLIKRLTLIAHGNRIEAVFYPIREPEQNAADVMRWLKEHPLETR